MVQTLDDITRQAHQGSVAAIIQVLNAQLGENGVRTRAVVAHGFLQLLCEANSKEKLEQSALVERLQTLLESIQPRYIRRVRVNARLVSEQQLLWLDEIERDPDSQLLWSVEFVIPRPRLHQQLHNTWADWRNRNHLSGRVLADTAKRERQRRRVGRILIGSSGFALFLGLMGWVAYDFWGIGQRRPGSPIAGTQAEESATVTVARDAQADGAIANSSPDNSGTEEDTPVANANTTPAAADLPEINGTQLDGQQDSAMDSGDGAAFDPFEQAVRLAQQAVQDGQVATTVDEWLALAATWQRASELMGDVPPDDDRYAIAQDRIATYLQYSVDSRKQANLARQQQEGQSTQPL